MIFAMSSLSRDGSCGLSRWLHRWVPMGSLCNLLCALMCCCACATRGLLSNFLLPMCYYSQESYLGEGAKRVEQGLRRALVVLEGDLANLRRLLAFLFSRGGDGGAEFG